MIHLDSDGHRHKPRCRWDSDDLQHVRSIDPATIWILMGSEKINLSLFSSNMADNLKARKTHLLALLDVVYSNSKKTTAIQILTAKEIESEISLIIHQLRRWN